MSAPGAAWQRPELAAAFVEDRRRLIPLIDGQDQLLRELVTRGERRVQRFLDLGTGAGAFAQLMMEMHPGATGVLVDFSEPMIAAARDRLSANAGRWEYVRADLSDARWTDALPDDRYDAVVSAFCIHHLPDERKRALYLEIYELLEPGGLFLNHEHVAATGFVAGMLEEWTVKRLLESERERPEPRSEEEILRIYFDSAEEDILTSPYLQCEWLRELGFEDVDIFFQVPEIAIFGGVKPKRGGR